MTHKPARRVIPRGPAWVVGMFPSRKNGRMVHWESQLERDRMYILEFDPEVLSFKEQPETYEFDLDGKSIRYTPDLEVKRKDGNVTIEEVKPSSRTQKYAVLFDRAKEVFAGEGKHFQVVDDTVIRQQPRLDTIKYLLPFRRFTVAEDILECVYDRFSNTSCFTFGVLSDFLRKQGLTPSSRWIILAHNHLLFDLNTTLSPTSELWLPKGY